MVAKAKESYQIQKARKKLAKQFEAEDKRINQKAIDQMKQAIQIWISRHKAERVELKDLQVELFDENKHSAQVKSKFVKEMLQKLKSPTKKGSPMQKLAGRVKKD